MRGSRDISPFKDRGKFFNGSKTPRRGFTLVELVAVIVVLSVLSAVAIPKFLDYRTHAMGTAIAANLRVYSQACHAYLRDHGRWPGTDGGSGLGTDLDSYIEHGTMNFPTPPGFAFFDGASDGSVPPSVGLYATKIPMAAVTIADQLADDGDVNTGFMTGGTYGNGNTWIEYRPQ